MSCSNLTAGIALDCFDNTGGVFKVYIANGPVESFTVSGANKVDSMVINSVGVVDTDWFVFELPKQVASFTETVNVSQETGTIFYDQQLTLIFNKMTTAKRDQLRLMAEANAMVVAFEDLNGRYWLLGLERGAFVNTGTTETGTAYGDRNGYTITLQGLETKPVYEIDPTVVGAGNMIP